MRSCGGRKICGALVERFVGHQCECEGFLRVCGNTEFCRGYDVHLRECGGDLREHQRVAGAAAGNNHLLNFVRWKNETMQRIDYGQGREDRGGADRVCGLGFVAPG